MSRRHDAAAGAGGEPNRVETLDGERVEDEGSDEDGGEGREQGGEAFEGQALVGAWPAAVWWWGVVRSSKIGGVQKLLKTEGGAFLSNGRCFMIQLAMGHGRIGNCIAIFASLYLWQCYPRS